MNKTILKTIVTVLTVAMLTAGVTTLASCKSKDTKKTSQQATVTDASGNPIVVPAALPSVATGTMTINGQKVSAAEIDYYYYSIYSTYGQYGAFAAVPTVAADGNPDLSVACNMPGFENMPWKDFLMQQAQKELQDMYIFSDSATSAGMVMTEKDLNDIASFFADVQTYADQYSLTADEFLKTKFGVNASKDALTPFFTRMLLAGQFVAKLQSSYSFTPAELQNFYTENQTAYKNIDIPTVRHILFWAPVGVSGSVDATTEELAAAKALADAARIQIITYDDMVAFGDAAVADGTARESAEYAVAAGMMVAPFEEWSLDAARKPGDTAVVKTEYGYHVMFFVGTQKDWEADAKASLAEEKFAAYLTEQEALPQYKLVIN